MRSRKEHCEENRKQYNKLTREIKKKAKQCREQWIEGKCEEVENSAGRQKTRELFKTAKELCGTISHKITTVQDTNGKLLEVKEKIKNRWREYYEELYN